ncbi:hypothetical protein [Streptomyces netropsis]|uniref:Uncharacterized protein n=1 Tax=Streptomyces netropsis TaxID=55404 RepID=A0A7W7LE45_STRNE|nr:hypothetical protein [Streptomyces netropsis]MBB4888533.1 hypothetical protein [Streptomyces netropsis]GGR13208.1 hypothetical protein GCM10010219_17440 [Streptomyces netropsis]
MATSRADALAIKAEIVAADAPAKTWHFQTFATLEEAVIFVNSEPPQAAGEFGISNRSDGQVDAIYYL